MTAMHESTARALLQRWSIERGGDAAFIDFRRRGDYCIITYKELWESTSKIASALSLDAIAPGEIVGILLADSERATELVQFWYALQFVGAVPVVVPVEGASLCGRVIGGGTLVPLGRHEDDVTNHWNRVIPFDDLLGGKNQSPEIDSRSPRADDVAFISWTSGSINGVPKAIGYTNGLVYGHLRIPFPGLQESRGLHRCELQSIARGTPLYILQNPDAKLFVQAIEELRPKQATLWPDMALQLAYASWAPRYDLSSINMLRVSGGRTPPKTAARLAALFCNAMLANVYGLTEAYPAWTCRLFSEEELRSAGPSLPAGCSGESFIDVVVVDDRQDILPQGQLGEIAFEFKKDPKPLLMSADGGSPQNSGRRILSGDIGTIDAQGDLVVVGRRDDVIMRGGYPINAGQVEDVLVSAPPVNAAAVAGVPDSRLGEEVAALVVLSDNAALDRLAEFCKERLHAREVPRILIPVVAIPMNTNGKRDRREIFRLLNKGAVSHRVT